MPRRTMVISDVHGCYDEFCALLTRLRWEPPDRLILLGDYIDRGPKSRETLQLVHSLERQGAVCLCGNHEDMFVRWLDRDEKEEGRYLRGDIGGGATLQSLLGHSPDDEDAARREILALYSGIVTWLRQLPHYWEDERHIFVHAGVNPSLRDWKETDPDDMVWIRDAFIASSVSYGKTIVFGHTRTPFLHGDPNRFDPWFSEDKIGIDGGCAYGGQLNALVITEGGYEVVSVKSAQSLPNGL